MAPPQAPASSGMLNAGKGPSSGGGSGPQQPQKGSGSQGPSQGFAAKKRKGEGRQADRQKRKKLAQGLNKGTLELQNWLCDMDAAARGADYPTGKDIKKANERKPNFIVLSSTNAVKELGSPTKVLGNVKTTFRLDSQYPSLVLVLDEYEIRISGQNMARHADAEGDPVFQRTFIDAKTYSDIRVRNHLEMELQHDEIETTAELGKFGKIEQQPEQTGLTFLTFNIKPKSHFQVRWTGIGERKKSPAVDELLSYLKKESPLFTLVRRTNAIMHKLDALFMHAIRVVSDKGLMPFFTPFVDATLNARFQKYIDDPDKKIAHQPWMQLPSSVNSVERKKYAAHLAKTHFGHLAEWETVLSVALIHETAFENMCIEQYFNWETEHAGEIIERRGGHVKVAMELVRRDNVVGPPIADGTRFSVRMGSLVVPDGEGELSRDAEGDAEMKDDGAAEEPEAPSTEEKSNAKPNETEQEASLMDYVVEKPSNKELKATRKVVKNTGESATQEDHPAGSVTPATQRPQSPTVEEVQDESLATPQPGPSLSKGEQEEQDQLAAAKNLSESNEDVTMEGTDEAATEAAERQWKARAIAKETTRSYVISFMVKKSEQHLFREGAKINLKLTMKRNALPSTRMLRAIGYVAREGAKNNTYSNYLRAFLLGDVLPEAAGEAPLVAAQKLKKEVRETFDKWVKTLKLNAPQQAAWNSIFQTGNNINMIQGPPGTGKTSLDVSIALSFALLDMRVAMTAPTNKACEALMDGLIEKHEKLCAEDPQVQKNVKIIFYPTNATLKEQLGATDEEIEAEVNATVVDGDETAKKRDYSPYMLWTHVVGSFERKATNDKPEDSNAKKAAKAWLDTLAKIRGGVGVDRKTLRAFHNQGAGASRDVLSDPSVKIVVATSNNSAQLANYDYNPDALIIDECAFATEHDSCVPLTLNARHIVLSGDYEQLKPGTGSHGENEYIQNLELPLFERVLKNRNVPLFRLKINYRMHPDIALLLGSLSYGWLGCDPSTEEETELYEYVKNFWHSEAGLKWRRARRTCPWDKTKAGKSIRRLFFNVVGGTSAHPPDSSSYVNYANAHAIAEYAVQLLGHGAKIGKTLSPNDITIITGYKEQKAVIEKLLKLLIEWYGWTSMPRVVTINSIQGGQNEIVILDITVANEWHGSLIGFLAKWNRMNVALTRAKQHLFIFGNIDCWRKELKTIVVDFKCKKFGLFVVDLIDRCDIIDINLSTTDRLPASREEMEGSEQNWSLIMPKMSPRESRMLPKTEKSAKLYSSSKEADKLKYEMELLKTLQGIYMRRDEMEARFKKGLEVETDLFHTLKGKSVDKDASEGQGDHEKDENPNELAKDLETQGGDDDDMAIDPENPDPAFVEEQRKLMSDIQANQTGSESEVDKQADALAEKMDLSKQGPADPSYVSHMSAARPTTPPPPPPPMGNFALPSGASPLEAPPKPEGPKLPDGTDNSKDLNQNKQKKKDRNRFDKPWRGGKKS